MTDRENFGSKIGAILAAAGSAVGLGNIWRFPIETGQNGGAAYIIIYMSCVILLGIPVMMSEFLVGRHTHANTAGAYNLLAPRTQWKWVGRLGVLSAFLILSYYAVVAGWTFEYAYLSITDKFAGKSVNDYKPIFNQFVTNPWKPLVWTIVVLLITHFVITRGVKKGIERYSKILMPSLFIIIIILVISSVNLPGASAGIDFLLKPDFSKVGNGVILSAIGQAFYSLSLGMGCLTTYASYFRDDTSLGKTALNVGFIDTMVALMSGFIIFPAVFNAGYSLQPQDIGPSLIFITLPNVFQQSFAGLPIIGYLFAVLFYLLLIVAAITSSISLHEVVTAYLREEYKISRRRSAIMVTVGCLLLGSLCSLSFGVLSGVTICERSIFDMFDFITSNILVPLSGISVAIFVGWYLDRKLVENEITNHGRIRGRYLPYVRFLIRYIAPLAIVAILLNQFGLI